jgi:4-cresol dehydrogenase (hydroxylating) flavoprotein subunit
MDNNAISEWQQILGEAYVIVEESCLQALETATFSTDQSVSAVLKPATSEEVQACLKVANHYHIPIYPISTGNNWGYGSSVPTVSGSVVMDLGRMNQIVDFNEDLAYVTLEPGVTQRQLYTFLKDQKSSLWMDATGSSPDCSIIGNTLERGFGHTPYGDHFAHSCGMEVVLPTGELIHTGFGRFENSQAKSIYAWGVGPWLDGLFSQSNFGIVTQMTIWLMPAPEYFQAFYFSIDQEDKLPGLINALRPLRLNGTIKSAVHIGNHYKVLSSMQQYPWALTQGTTPLPEEVLSELIGNLGIGVWNGSGALYGTHRQVAEARRLIATALRGKVKRLQFLDDQILEFAAQFAKPYQWMTGLNLSRVLQVLKPVYGLMKGIPTETQIASTYWRKKDPVSKANMDPDRDRCGLMWCAPIAPLDGDHAVKVRDIAYRVLGDEFEPMISITLLTERSLSCLITISFDRDQPGEDEKAQSRFHILSQKLAEFGYYPYRIGIQDKVLEKTDSSNQKLLTTIKQSLDPENILSPKRY